MININSIIYVLQKTRFDLSVEKTLQTQISASLTLHNVEHKREVTLDKGHIIDFMIEDIGIEIKLKGSSKEIYRQVERYTKFEEVRGIILLTNKIMRLPDWIDSPGARIEIQLAKDLKMPIIYEKVADYKVAKIVEERDTYNADH